MKNPSCRGAVSLRKSISGLSMLPLALAFVHCGGGGGGPAGSGGNGGNGGMSAGTGGSGTGTGGAAGGASGTGGAAATTGPGIPTNGDLHCLVDAPNADTAFYFGVDRACVIFKKAGGGTPTDGERNALVAQCMFSYSGTVVTACPAADTPVAYCPGTLAVATAAGIVMYDRTQVFYSSAVTPDADAVARNGVNLCPLLPVYDPSNRRHTASCAGTVTATVDGVAFDFSEKLLCAFRTDGTRSIYTVDGTHTPSAVDQRTLVLNVLKTGAAAAAFGTALGTPPVGYSEGQTAGGAFAFPVGTPAPAFQAQTFTTTGDALSGTFEIGTISTSPTGSGGSSRVITAGSVNVTMTVQ